MHDAITAKRWWQEFISRFHFSVIKHYSIPLLFYEFFGSQTIRLNLLNIPENSDF